MGASADRSPTFRASDRARLYIGAAGFLASRLRERGGELLDLGGGDSRGGVECAGSFGSAALRSR